MDPCWVLSYEAPANITAANALVYQLGYETMYFNFAFA
jgi:hypothetical protein